MSRRRHDGWRRRLLLLRRGAPPECSEFLNFVDAEEVPGGLRQRVPHAARQPGGAGRRDRAALLDVLASYNEAPYVSLWLDTLYGQNVGNALNTGVVNMLAGQGDPAAIVQGVVDAAAKE